MPIYLYLCEECGGKVELRQDIGGAVPLCCAKAMTMLRTSPAIVKVEGTGHSVGYKKGYREEYLKSTNREVRGDTIIPH